MRCAILLKKENESLVVREQTRNRKICIIPYLIDIKSNLVSSLACTLDFGELLLEAHIVLLFDILELESCIISERN